MTNDKDEPIKYLEDLTGTRLIHAVTPPAELGAAIASGKRYIDVKIDDDVYRFGYDESEDDFVVDVAELPHDEELTSGMSTLVHAKTGEPCPIMVTFRGRCTCRNLEPSVAAKCIDELYAIDELTGNIVLDVGIADAGSSLSRAVDGLYDDPKRSGRFFAAFSVDGLQREWHRDRVTDTGWREEPIVTPPTLAEIEALGPVVRNDK